MKKFKIFKVMKSMSKPDLAIYLTIFLMIIFEYSILDILYLST